MSQLKINIMDGGSSMDGCKILVKDGKNVFFFFKCHKVLVSEISVAGFHVHSLNTHTFVSAAVMAYNT